MSLKALTVGIHQLDENLKRVDLRLAAHHDIPWDYIRVSSDRKIYDVRLIEFTTIIKFKAFLNKKCISTTKFKAYLCALF
jgi:hypothetical protein